MAHFFNFGPIISLRWAKLDTSNLVCRLILTSTAWCMRDKLPLNGCVRLNFGNLMNPINPRNSGPWAIWIATGGQVLSLLIYSASQGSNPRSSHSRESWMCKLQNNCSCLTCKQNPSSDQTGKYPSEDQNRNCRRKARFRQRRGTRDQVTNLRILMHKAREHQQAFCMCFVDFKKAFDSISHDQLWVTMMDMGYPLHLIDLLAQLYRKQLTIRSK